MRAVLVIAVVARTAAANPTAAQILDQTNQAYAHAKTYVDRGVQSSGFLTLRHPFVHQLTFTTAFVRDGEFRFEYRDEGRAKDAYIIWSDGTQTLFETYFDHRVTPAPDLASALGAAYGVSGATSHLIPALLHAEKSITDLTSPKREPDDKIGGHRCYRISGTIKDRNVTLWIDIKTHAIRQIRESYVLDSGPASIDIDEVTGFEPVFDAPVDPKWLAKLEFQPPPPHQPFETFGEIQ